MASTDEARPVAVRRVIVVAASPRTGSSLLCRALAGTGRVGDPKEYLNPSLRRPMFEQMGCFDLTPRGNLGRLRRRLRGDSDWRMTTLTRLTNRRLGVLMNWVAGHASAEGVLSLKLMWNHYEPLLDRGSSVSFWGAPVTWVWIRRRDRVRQAVSWCRAEQTGSWHAEESERVEPVYDAVRIERLIQLSMKHEREWRDYFERQAIKPLEVFYEDLDDDYEGTMRVVFGHLGLVDATLVDRPLVRQADALNEAWIERWRASVRAGADRAAVESLPPERR